MHECPECGQACDCDGEDVWTDYYNECTHPECEADYEDDRLNDLDACVVCGSPNVTSECQCCGEQLCHMHFEIGLGFCRSCPTAEWKAEQIPVAPPWPVRSVKPGLDDELPF